MNRLPTILAFLCIGWCTSDLPDALRTARAAADPELSEGAWPVERVELLDGRSYEGYIESEDAVWLNIRQILRPQGRPMILVVHPIARESIKKVVRLDPTERARLQERIQRLINRAAIERGRMDAVQLGQVTRGGLQYHRYSGKWFTLESGAEESITRRMIVRIEQVFTAYRQIVAPRTEPRGPRLRLVVLGSMADYQSYLARLNVKIDNPACFLPEENLLVAGSQLTRFAAELEKINARHDQLARELDHLEQELPARLKDLAQKLKAEGISDAKHVLLSARRKFLEEISQKRVELNRCNRRNARAFEACTEATFARLYHEAFHAYLENYVYPRGEFDVPLWLNEGLAVTFERGVVETDTFRVDAPNRRALEALKTDLRGPQPLPLAEVLAADQEAFVSSPEAARYYVYSWGLAHYLTFEKQLLHCLALEKYVQPASGVSDVARFEQLLDVPLSRFEPLWRTYILQLR